MTSALAVPLFVVSLAVTLAAAQSFARRLDRLGTRLGFPEALIGLLTALAADGPEISSALIALGKSKNSISVGVLLGSNVFNLAAMIGLSAVLVGSVRLPRKTLLLEGAVGGLVTVIAAGVLLGGLPPSAAALLLAGVAVPYVLLLLRGPQALARVPFANKLVYGLDRALAHRPGSGRPCRTPAVARWEEMLFVVDIALIVLGSLGMVQAAISLGDRWQISDALIGVLVLAPLTSIPNAVTALRLGVAGRGSALVSESFNSNTINLAVGVVVPALFVTIAAASGLAKFDVAWLLVMTAVCVALLYRPSGMRRVAALGFIALYAIFVAIQLIYA